VREVNQDPFGTITTVIPWDRFRASVSEAEALARSEDLVPANVNHFTLVVRDLLLDFPWTRPRSPSKRASVHRAALKHTQIIDQFSPGEGHVDDGFRG
jgi:hypothetical protein